jgi:hypothetical protein
VFGEHASDHVFIDVNSERFVDLLRDPGAANPGITLFHFNNETNENIRGTFGPGLVVFRDENNR